MSWHCRTVTGVWWRFSCGTWFCYMQAIAASRHVFFWVADILNSSLLAWKMPTLYSHFHHVAWFPGPRDFRTWMDNLKYPAVHDSRDSDDASPLGPIKRVTFKKKASSFPFEPLRPAASHFKPHKMETESTSKLFQSHLIHHSETTTDPKSFVVSLGFIILQFLSMGRLFGLLEAFLGFRVSYVAFSWFLHVSPMFYGFYMFLHCFSHFKSCHQRLPLPGLASAEATQLHCAGE